MRSTSTLRRLWAPPCETTHVVTIPLGDDGARATVHRETVAAWQALDAVMAAHGYEIRKRDTGAYNCRRITGGSGYSLHAFGIAVDVNWQSNPYGRRLVTDMPMAMVEEIEALQTDDGHRIFRWGGRYSAKKDAMHFEVIASPAELRTGVGGARVRPAAWEVVTIGDLIELGTKGEPVRKLQEQLNDLFGGGLSVDGYAGENTIAALRRAQEALGVTADGICGPRTWAALRAERRRRRTVAVSEAPEYLVVGDVALMDVHVGTAHAPEIAAAIRAGVLVPDAQGRFRPNEPITRAQLATVLARLELTDRDA